MFGKQQVLRKCKEYDNNNTVVQIMVSGTRRPELDSWSLLADDLGKVNCKISVPPFSSKIKTTFPPV